MKLSSALISRIAAASMALSLAMPMGAVEAQEIAPGDAGAVTTPVAQDGAPATPGTVPAGGGNGAANDNAGDNAAPRGELVSSWSVQVNPHLPLPLVLGFGGAYALFCLYAARNRFRGSWMRAAAGAAVVATLVNPELLQEERTRLPTEVTIVLDRSQSQMVDGRMGASEEAYAALLRRFEGMENVNVRTIEVGKPEGGRVPDGTRIFTDLAAGLTDVTPERLGAVFVITDGQVHDMREAGRAALGGAPVYVLLSGREAEKDRRVVIESAPRYGTLEQEQTIRFRVEDDGAQERAPVAVEIKAEDGTVLATRQVVPGESVSVDVRLPRVGNNVVLVEAAALAGELTAANNRAAVEIEGMRETMRVLLLTGAPNAGERAWRDFLKADPAVELVHFSKLRPTYLQDSTPLNELSVIALPMREIFEEKIDEFDLVIFDHYHADGTIPFDYLGMVADYVERGGALMVVSGADYAGALSLYNTPLSRVLPASPTGQVTEQAFAPRVNGDGARHPVTRGLGGDAPQWGRWHQIVDSNVAPDARVLMTGAGDKPLMVLDRQGEGRVGMIMSDNAWMWARGFEGGGPYDDLMARMSHWLMKAPGLEEEALRARVEGGQLTVERQSMEDQAGPVRLTDPMGITREVSLSQTVPGQWSVSVPVDQQGVYGVEQGDLAAIAHAGPASPREVADLRSTPDIVKPWVDASGGQVLRIGVAGGVAVPRVVPVTEAKEGTALSGADWLGVRMSAVSDLQGINRYSPLSGWLAFTLVVGLLAGAWLREGDPARTRRMFGGLLSGNKNSGPSI